MVVLLILNLLIVVTSASRPDGTTACDPDQRPVVRGPGDIFTSANFDTTSNYDPNAQCEYLLQVEAGATVQITFDYFMVEDSVDCTKDRLEVYQGTSDSGTLLATYCGFEAGAEDTFVIFGGVTDTFLKFVTDGDTEAIGFRGQVQETGNDPCDGGLVITNATRGTFSSPNYPQNYPTNQDCTWTFTPPPGNRVGISFQSFETEDICTITGDPYDFVEMSDSNNNILATWFADGPNNPYFVFTNNLASPSDVEDVTITFTTDSSVSERGFFAYWTLVPVTEFV